MKTITCVGILFASIVSMSSTIAANTCPISIKCTAEVLTSCTDHKQTPLPPIWKTITKPPLNVYLSLQHVWYQDNNGVIQCYYLSPKGDNVVLTSQNGMKLVNEKAWVWYQPNAIKQCNKSNLQCEFQP